MENLNELIGKIVRGFVRTEFMMSDVFFELGLTKERMSFFAEMNTRKKIESIKNQLIYSDITNKKECIALLDTFDSLRSERNIIVHSLVLSSASGDEQHVFHNYTLTKDYLSNGSRLYTTKDLIELNLNIAGVHNEFHRIYLELKKQPETK